MRSEKGLAIQKFLVILVALLMLLGVTTFVVMQDNGIYDREIKPLLQNQTEDTTLQTKIKLAKVEEKLHKINRPLGLASGFARGALSSFLILCVVNSLVRIFPEEIKNDETQVQTTENSMSLYDFILSSTNNDPVVADLINSITEYQQSGLINLTGMKFGDRTADEVFLDSIISGKSKDYSFALRKELKLVVQIAQEACSLTNGFDMESIDFTKLSKSQVENIQNILTILSNDDLLNNLDTALVGITLSLDAVAPYMPDNMTPEHYNSIDWSKELVTIAELIGDVYNLGDLSNLNYLDLDPVAVEKLVTTLSKLESINFLSYVGGSFAIKSLIAETEGLEEEVAIIEEKLAHLATTNGYTDSLNTYATLYGDFVELFSEMAFDKFKDEEGVINYVSALTSIDTNKYSTIINTVLQSDFVSEILPEVLSIIKETVIPKEYSSLINPNVVTSSQWENEINAVLKIVNDLTTDPTTQQKVPFDTIENYDFALLSNFTVETVIQSDLLSYAIINLFIDATKGEGLLQDSGNISEFISIPDTLAKPADQNHRFNSKWYGNETNNYADGELYIMLNTIKNIASNLESLDNPIDSLPAILASINTNELLKSDILYYSLNNMIDTVNQYVVIPLDDIRLSDDTVNNEYIDLISRDALTDLVDIITDENIIDLNSMLAYYEVYEDGTVSDKPTNKEDKVEDKEYQVKVDFSNDNILNLLTSDKLYNSTTGNDKNLDKLFDSSILRATVTNVLDVVAGEFITVPNSAIEASLNCYVSDEDGNKETKTIDVISKTQFKRLVMAISDLDIDLTDVTEDPLNIIDTLVIDNELKDEAKAVFTTSSSKYSGILHATLSSYVIDLASDNSGSLNIIIPSEVIDPSDRKLLTSEETISLINSISIIGTDVFDSQDNTIDDVINCVIDNNKALESTIIRATITNYISGDEYNLDIPNSVYDPTITSTNVILEKDILDLLSAIDALKETSNNDASYSDLLDVNNLTFGQISKADGVPGQPISNSIIIRSILTTQIENAGIALVEEALDDEGIISASETHSLISTVSQLLGEESSISNINVDNVTIGKLDDCKYSINSSLLIRNLLSEKLTVAENAISVPEKLYDSSISSVKVINKEETSSLISSLVALLGRDCSLTNLPAINNINMVELSNNIETILASDIIRATISKEIFKQEMIVIMQSDIDSSITDIETIQYQALVDLFNALSVMNVADISDITVESLKIDKNHVHQVSESSIIRATLTKNIKINDVTIYASENAVSVEQDHNGNDILVLKEDESVALIRAISLLSSEGRIEMTIDVQSLVSLSSESLNTILDSSVIRVAVSDIVSYGAILAGAYSTYEYVYELPSTFEPTRKKLYDKNNIIKIVNYFKKYY